VSETKGDLKNAIRHRENEIRLIRRLHQLSQGTESEAYAFSQYDYEDLADRLYLLATLYHDSGDLDKAIATLEETKRLSEAQGLEFEWRDDVREWLKERGRITDSVIIGQIKLVSESGQIHAMTYSPLNPFVHLSENSAAVVRNGAEPVHQVIPGFQATLRYSGLPGRQLTVASG